MKSSYNYLIVGASGFIGKELLKENNEGNNVISTSRRKKEGFIKFDLKEDKIDDILEDHKSYIVYFLAGITGLSECHDNKELSYLINVERTIEAINTLDKRGDKIVYFSSDAVFSGDHVKLKEEDPTRPLSNYGKQKALVEEYIINNVRDHLIIRTSKIYDDSFIMNLALEMKKNEEIICLSDQLTSYVEIHEFIKVVIDLVEQKKSGIYHISTDQLYSRYNLLKMISHHLNLEYKNYKEMTSTEAGFSDSFPKSFNLDNAKIKSESSIRLSELEDRIKLIKIESL